MKDRRRDLRKHQTRAESILWKSLRDRQLGGCRFHRQYGVGSYIADFYCPGAWFVIELDGGHHGLGLRELRFWNNEVEHEFDSVLEKIRVELGLYLPLGTVVRERRDSTGQSTRQLVNSLTR